jgi:uncharacterized protein (DUF1697 family)
MRYVAFLRGINVGGNQLVKMNDLRAVFQKLGLADVSTLLASGNVVFEGGRAGEASLVGKIEAALAAAFDRDLKIVLRSREELQRLVEAKPFARIAITRDVHAYATFLQNGPGRYRSMPAGKGFQVVGVVDRTVLTTVDLSSSMTTDLMRVLERAFGKEITTRNWNTVERVSQLLGRNLRA